jgi:hypothetical protein
VVKYIAGDFKDESKFTFEALILMNWACERVVVKALSRAQGHEEVSEGFFLDAFKLENGVKPLRLRWGASATRSGASQAVSLEVLEKKKSVYLFKSQGLLYDPDAPINVDLEEEDADSEFLPEEEDEEEEEEEESDESEGEDYIDWPVLDRYDNIKFVPYSSFSPLHNMMQKIAYYFYLEDQGLFQNLLKEIVDYIGQNPPSVNVQCSVTGQTPLMTLLQSCFEGSSGMGDEVPDLEKRWFVPIINAAAKHIDPSLKDARGYNLSDFLLLGQPIFNLQKRSFESESAFNFWNCRSLIRDVAGGHYESISYPEKQPHHQVIRLLGYMENRTILMVSDKTAQRLAGGSESEEDREIVRMLFDFVLEILIRDTIMLAEARRSNVVTVTEVEYVIPELFRTFDYSLKN